MTLQRQIGHQLAAIVGTKRRLLDAEMKSLKLCRTQWQVLCWLEYLGPCSQKILLQHMEVDAAHLARTLELCEQQGYITRKPMPNDRRSLFIELTPLSQNNLIPHLRGATERVHHALFSDLTLAEQTLLHQFLSRIEAQLKSLPNFDKYSIKTAHNRTYQHFGYFKILLSI